MQHTQFNVSSHVVTIILLLTAFPAAAATMAGPSKPDPLLDGGPTTACAAGADYAAGIDANGNAVVPADVGAQRVPVPDEIAIPLARGSQGGRVRPTAGNSDYVSLDGKKLAPLLNPPACKPGG
jgi:hypothetical protein